MDTKKKPAPGWHRETGYDTAFDSRNHSLFASRLKALLIGIAAYDTALLAMALIFAFVPILALWGALR